MIMKYSDIIKANRNLIAAKNNIIITYNKIMQGTKYFNFDVQQLTCSDRFAQNFAQQFNNFV